MRDDDEPAMLCGRGACQSKAARKQGHQWLCEKHYRYGQMRSLAQRRGLYVPSVDVLDSLLRPGFLCQDCNCRMNWLGKDGQATVATLQHYRDGCCGIVCRSCNTRHAYMPGDTFRQMPKDHKWCPRCKATKPFAMFSTDNGRSGPMKLKSHCKACSDVAQANWREANRDYYNAKQRERRAIRAAR